MTDKIFLANTLVIYRERAIHIRGQVRNRSVSGNGSVEMTEYAGKVTN